MSGDRSWLALVTFERRSGDADLLPAWAHGACGWMIALGPDFETAHQRLTHDLEHAGFRTLEVADEREVLTPQDVEEVDIHLAHNWREIEPGKLTVWGTLHGYKGEGEA